MAFAAAFAVAGRSASDRHHDPLTVRGQDQDITVIGGGAGRPLVVGREVHRSPARQLLDLAFPDLDTGRSPQRRPRIVEAAPCRFDGGELAQPVGVEFGRNVQRRVGWIQVGFAAVTVGKAIDVHRAEHRL